MRQLIDFDQPVLSVEPEAILPVRGYERRVAQAFPIASDQCPFVRFRPFVPDEPARVFERRQARDLIPVNKDVTGSVAFFADEDACRAAYVAAGGKTNGNGHNGRLSSLEAALRRQVERQMKALFIRNVLADVAVRS